MMAETILNLCATFNRLIRVGIRRNDVADYPAILSETGVSSRELASQRTGGF